MSTSAKIEKELTQPDLPSITQIQQLVSAILPQFDHAVKTYVMFNIICLGLGSLAFFLFIISFLLLAQSAIMATTLAFVFLIFFAYFILRLYLQFRKEEQLKELRECYISACKNLLNYKEGVPQNHAALANACIKLANNLQGREYHIYIIPPRFQKFKAWIDKTSHWFHWLDIHHMKELLFEEVVRENIKLVKCAPSSLEVHVALANAYVTLSGLYVKEEAAKDANSNEKLSAEFSKKFRLAAEGAIEELKILQEFAPDDPWVHEQLAYSYRDLKMPQEEIREYETMLRLMPGNRETLFKLGRLYFQHGRNGQGLRIYDQLKKLQDRRAEELINHYGGYRIS